jgi:hypothetical protein
MTDILVSHFWVGDHHPWWWINTLFITLGDELIGSSPGPAPRSSRRAPIEPARPRPHVTQPFTASLSHFAKALATFRSRLVIFVIINSTILLQWTQPLYYGAQLFSDCCSAQSFLIATMLNHFSIAIMLNYFWSLHPSRNGWCHWFFVTFDNSYYLK